MLRAQGIQTISWAELGQRANGHKVVVSFESGDPIQGKVVRWDGRSLTVRTAGAGQDRELLPSGIALVRVDPRRGRAGRFIGLAAGIALGTASGVQSGAERAGRDTGTVVVSAAAWAGIGTLVGWLVDALRTGKPVLYRIVAEP
jgi:hypothetical protein